MHGWQKVLLTTLLGTSALDVTAGVITWQRSVALGFLSGSGAVSSSKVSFCLIADYARMFGLRDRVLLSNQRVV